LQTSIDTLNDFTKEWFLEANPKKTKCLVFARGNKCKTPNNFHMGETPLQMCDSYCYLGVVFARSGSMKTAAQVLNDKAIGAMFSIIRNINKHYACNISLLLELFDKMVIPISTYNSEVWGVNILPHNMKNNEYLSTNNLAKTLIEGLHVKFVKMILGLSQKASNWAVMSEVGRYPIAIKVFSAIVKFLFHIADTPSPILYAALRTSINLSNEGFNSWFKGVYRILDFCGLTHLLYTSDKLEIQIQVSRMKRILQTKYRDIWGKERTQFMNGSKLELFTTLKEKFDKSPYLTMLKKPSHRIAMTRMRISAHKFPIETGRYLKIPRGERLCPLGCGKVGDEVHYLLQCRHPFLRDIHKTIIEDITKIHPETQLMDQGEKCKCFLNCSDLHTLNLVGRLCYDSQEVYKEITI
jgi:hypothetical protein